MSAAKELDDAERWRDRGAYFRSIAETLNHILWDDRVWLARLASDKSLAAEIGAQHPYTATPHEWSAYCTARIELDKTIIDLAKGLSDADMGRAVTWQRGPDTVQTTVGFNLLHMFNHQTHHRGQVHAMLTAAGQSPDATDLQVLALREAQGTDVP